MTVGKFCRYKPYLLVISNWFISNRLIVLNAFPIDFKTRGESALQCQSFLLWITFPNSNSRFLLHTGTFHARISRPTQIKYGWIKLKGSNVELIISRTGITHTIRTDLCIPRPHESCNGHGNHCIRVHNPVWKRAKGQFNCWIIHPRTRPLPIPEGIFPNKLCRQRGFLLRSRFWNVVAFGLVHFLRF